MDRSRTVTEEKKNNKIDSTLGRDSDWRKEAEEIKAGAEAQALKNYEEKKRLEDEARERQGEADMKTLIETHPDQARIMAAKKAERDLELKVQAENAAKREEEAKKSA